LIITDSVANIYDNRPLPQTVLTGPLFL